MMQGMGALERATGLDELSVDQVKTLGRRRIWYLFALAKVLGAAPIRIFVALDGERVVATASVVLLPKAGYVMGVATDSGYRRRGIASSLLELIHAYARDKGRPWTALDVESDNEVAISVYRRLGYDARARFGWYTGSPGPGASGPTAGAQAVEGRRMGEVASWVNRSRPMSVGAALPATNGRLSHLEVITRLGGAPVKTWALTAASGELEGVARATFVPTVRTAYVVPSAWKNGAGKEALTSLFAPAMTWAQELGASRAVAVVPDRDELWRSVMAESGLTLSVSSTLMTRPQPSGASGSQDAGFRV